MGRGYIGQAPAELPVDAGSLEGTLPNGVFPTGSVVQKAYFASGGVATGSTTIPGDDTIPQVTEGNEYLSVSITPRSTTNILRVSVVLNAAFNATGHWTTALFRDGGANALAASIQYFETANAIRNVRILHEVVAGSTSSTTFTVRSGVNNAGTLTLNGFLSGRILGGALTSSISILELKA